MIHVTLCTHFYLSMNHRISPLLRKCEIVQRSFGNCIIFILSHLLWTSYDLTMLGRRFLGVFPVSYALSCIRSNRPKSFELKLLLLMNMISPQRSHTGIHLWLRKLIWCEYGPKFSSKWHDFSDIIVEKSLEVWGVRAEHGSVANCTVGQAPSCLCSDALRISLFWDVVYKC